LNKDAMSIRAARMNRTKGKIIHDVWASKLKKSARWNIDKN